MTDETPSEILYLSYCYILERRRSASLCDTYVWGGGRTFLLWPKLLCLRFFYARSEEEPEHPFPQFCVLYEASRKVLSASFSNLEKTYQFDIWLFPDRYFDHFFNLCWSSRVLIQEFKLSLAARASAMMTTSSLPTLHQREMKAFVAMQFLKSFICAS